MGILIQRYTYNFGDTNPTLYLQFGDTNPNITLTILGILLIQHYTYNIGDTNPNITLTILEILLIQRYTYNFGDTTNPTLYLQFWGY